MSILRSNERKDDSNKLKQYNVIPYFNLILSRKSFYGSSFIQSLIPDRQGSNFESCVWRTVSSQSSHHPQEVLLAQFSLYVHKGGLKPDSFHFICLIPKNISHKEK